MPSQSSLTIDEIRTSSAQIRRDMDALYGGVRKGKFTDRKRITTERRIKAKIDELTAKSQKFYETQLQETFLAGARSIKEDYNLQEDDLKLLAKISDDGMTKIRTSDELAKRGVHRWGEVAEGSQWRGAAKRNMVRGMITTDGRKYHPDTYRTLVLSADASRTSNFGVVAGAQAAGVEQLICRDGSGCGWKTHNDPEAASGKIVTLDEALSHPIAHPFCQRTFEPYHGKKKPGDKPALGIAKTAAKIAAGGAVAAVAGAVTLKASKSLQVKLTELVALANPQFLQYRSRVLQVAAATRREFEDITAELRAEMDDWAENLDHELSEQAGTLLGVKQSSPRKVVGDTYDYIVDSERFSVMGQSDLDMMNSIGGHTLGSIIDDAGGRVTHQLPKVFRPGRTIGTTLEGRGFRAAGRVGRDVGGSVSQQLGKEIRVGASKITGSDTVVKYVNFQPNQLFKYRVSKVKYGVANRVVLNPNGMLRAGFAIDPRTGLITPSLRFLPKGPIRIFNEINRGRGTLQEGNILANDLKKVLSLKKTRKGHTAITETVKFEDLLRRGQPGQRGFIMTDDLLTTHGSVQDILSSDGIVRRGRIRNALSVIDADSGRRIKVDLIIHNGKFVKEYVSKNGAITSVSTTVRINVFKGLKFNLRTNLNLRGLGLDSLSDIRNLRLRDLAAINPARNFRIRSASLELRAFGYSVFEIGKILRMPWEDMQRLWRDTKNLMDDAYRKEVFQKYEQKLADLLGVEFLDKDLLAERLRGLPAEVRSKIKDAPGLIRDSAIALKEQWVDDPIKWVLGQKVHLEKLRGITEIKYKRPKLEPPTSIEDRLNRKNIHSTDPSPRFLSALDTQQTQDLTDVLYLSPEELADGLGVTVDEARDMHTRALAVFQDDFGRDAGKPIHAGIARHIGSVPIQADISDLDGPVADRMIKKIQFNNPRAPSTEVMRQVITQDIQTALSWIEEAYPGLDPIKIRFVSSDLYDNLGYMAQYHPAEDIKKSLQEAIVNGYIDNNAILDYNSSGEIWIYQKSMDMWIEKASSGKAIGHFADVGDVNLGLATMVHELGHHAHLARTVIGKQFAEEVQGKLVQLLKDKFGYDGSLDEEELNLFVLEEHKKISRAIGSKYAATNFWEFVAESFLVGNAQPGQKRLADSVTAILREAWT